MVEKAGHKGTMRVARQQWIDESKPRTAAAEDDEDYRIHQGTSGPQQADRVAPVFEKAAQAAQERATTPSADDLFGDDDIYNATPRRNPARTAPSRQVAGGDIPEEDDLDALMAEAEAESATRTQQTASSRPPAPAESIFGNGTRNTGAPGLSGEPDDDDLDALMAEAEAEAEAASAPTRPSHPGVSIFGEGKSQRQIAQQQGGGDEEDDLDALMAEYEAEVGPSHAL
jgi:replication fork protection complex subunit Csm3/Swi3